MQIEAIEPLHMDMYRLAYPQITAQATSTFVSIGSIRTEIGLINGGELALYRRIEIGASTLNVFEGQAITKTLVVLKITTSSILMRNRNTDIYLEVGNSTLADIYLPEARAAGSISTEVPTAEEPAPSRLGLSRQDCAFGAGT